MQVEVIEFEISCPDHGAHRIIVPVQSPWPRYCAHCFLPARSRRELRRFVMQGPLPAHLGSEAWIG